MEDINEKARRRIRRFIKTGVHQARVHPITKEVFAYKEKHHVKTLFFKLASDGRLFKKNSV